MVDLGQANSSRLKIALEIRIPGAHIGQFSVDRPMNTLALATTTGNTFLYNLPLALKNEQSLASQKIKMGVEKDIVHTYLHKVNAANLADQTSHKVEQSVDAQSIGLQSLSNYDGTGFGRPIQISIED